MNVKYIIYALFACTPTIFCAKNTWEQTLVINLLKTECNKLKQDSKPFIILNTIIKNVSNSNNTQSPLKNMNEQYSIIKNNTIKTMAIENKRFSLLTTPSRAQNDKDRTEKEFCQLDKIIERINVHYKAESALKKIGEIMPEYQ